LPPYHSKPFKLTALIKLLPEMADSSEKSAYDILVDVWRRERREEGLARIPDDLPDRLREYLGGIRHYLRTPDRESLSAELKLAAADAVTTLIEEIFELRLNKLIKSALKGSTPENLFEFEKTIYLKLVSILKEYRESVKELATAAAYQSWERITSSYEVVHFLKDVPEFVGPNLESYGPFKAGDIASLPPEVASNLELANLARIIRVLQPRS